MLPGVSVFGYFLLFFIILPFFLPLFLPLLSLFYFSLPLVIFIIFFPFYSPSHSFFFKLKHLIHTCLLHKCRTLKRKAACILISQIICTVKCLESILRDSFMCIFGLFLLFVKIGSCSTYCFYILDIFLCLNKLIYLDLCDGNMVIFICFFFT